MRDEKGRFLTGTKGGPGRSVGSRNKLGEDFLTDALEAWRAKGKVSLERMADDHPDRFCSMIAGILPKEMNLNHTNDLNADEIAARIAELVERESGNVLARNMALAAKATGTGKPN